MDDGIEINIRYSPDGTPSMWRDDQPVKLARTSEGFRIVERPDDLISMGTHRIVEGNALRDWLQGLKPGDSVSTPWDDD